MITGLPITSDRGLFVFFIGMCNSNSTTTVKQFTYQALREPGKTACKTGLKLLEVDEKRLSIPISQNDGKAVYIFYDLSIFVSKLIIRQYHVVQKKVTSR